MSTMITITYDPKADALAIQLHHAPRGTHVRTVSVVPGVGVDLDAQGHLYALEILDASHRIPRKVLDALPSGAEYLTIPEAAKESRLRAQTLRNLITQKRLPATKRGRDWYIEATDLLNYQESRATSGRPATDPRARARKSARKSVSTTGVRQAG